MRYTYAMRSRQGSRDYNEDAIRMREKERGVLFVLADGLGGLGNGNIASETAIQSVIGRYEWENPSEEFMDKAFCGAQDAVLTKQQENSELGKMSTTLTMLELSKDGARWGHIGDSRIYMFRKGKILFQTEDHSVPQMLVAMGEIKASEIRYHRDRNRLLKTIGQPWSGKDYTLAEKVEIKNGDCWLLCSDGFWEYITEEEMCKILKKSHSMEEWLERMEKVVCKNGEGQDMDNFSAICVRAEEVETW